MTTEIAGTLERVRGLTVLWAGGDLLGVRTAARAPLRVAGASVTTYLFRVADRTAVVIPDGVCEQAGLAPGDAVRVEVALRPPGAGQRLPGDLGATLERASVDFDLLPPPERRQSLMVIGEARSPAVRRARIAALANAWASHRETSPRRDGLPAHRPTQEVGP